MKDGTTRYATGTPCPVKDSRGHAIASCERHRLTAGDRHFDDGVSPVISEILLVAVTVILAAIVAASIFGLFSDSISTSEPPEILKITSISHYSDSGK
ncbi:MAG TPA: type IV pilin N-terminal domain-containing protein, partial [Methanocorpusculum sp.]|nr:type IV pilin N-terminal domain-containing protein [Methanocorpusculum sp.]